MSDRLHARFCRLAPDLREDVLRAAIALAELADTLPDRLISSEIFKALPVADRRLLGCVLGELEKPPAF